MVLDPHRLLAVQKIQKFDYLMLILFIFIFSQWKRDSNPRHSSLDDIRRYNTVTCLNIMTSYNYIKCQRILYVRCIQLKNNRTFTLTCDSWQPFSRLYPSLSSSQHRRQISTTSFMWNLKRVSGRVVVVVVLVTKYILIFCLRMKLFF